MRRLSVAVLILVLTLLIPGSAEAYIGPGAAAGTVAAVLGIIASIFMAFLAVLWYPVKRLLKLCKRAKPADSGDG
jgi:TM2 domain-containing membrane protein YozV